MIRMLKGKLGQLEASVSSFRKVLQLQPDHAVANVVLSRIYQYQGNIDEGLDYRGCSTSTDPESREAWELLGGILAISGDNPAGETACRQLSELQSDSVEACT